MSLLILSDAEKKSATYRKIKKHLEVRLEVLRSKNDAPQSEAETEFLRGQIKEIKALLNLDKEPVKFHTPMITVTGAA